MGVEDIKKALGRQMVQYRSNMLMTRIEDFLFENNK